MKRLYQRLVSFYKKHPLVFIAIVIFIVALIISFRNAIIQTLKDKLGMPDLNVTGVPRGIKNNNPLNIRASKIVWKGEIIGADKDFESFDTMVNGVRAAIINLKAYVSKKGDKNVYEIIHRWAPASDGNNPGSYVNLVLKDLGKQTNNHYTNEWLPTSAESWARLAYAMSAVEVGAKYRPAFVVFQTVSNEVK